MGAVKKLLGDTEVASIRGTRDKSLISDDVVNDSAIAEINSVDKRQAYQLIADAKKCFNDCKKKGLYNNIFLGYKHISCIYINFYLIIPPTKTKCGSKTEFTIKESGYRYYNTHLGYKHIGSIINIHATHLIDLHHEKSNTEE